jgi:hypothetical protein
LSPAFIFGIWVAAQPAAAPAAAPPVSWSSELKLPSLAAIDEALAQPVNDMPDVVLEDQSVHAIKTCKDLLAVAKVKFHPSPDNGDAWDSILNNGLRCFALDALKAAKPAAASYLGWFKFSRAGVAKLPAGLTMQFAAADQARVLKAEKACKAWGKYDPSLTLKLDGTDQGEVRGHGWAGRLTLYARGDLDGDGIEDLMVLREGQVEGGTASSSMIFIITQTSAKGCPQVARKIPQSLGAGGGG